MSDYAPMKFTQIFRKKVWGGRKLRTLLNKEILRETTVGESWEVADRGVDASIVCGGEHEGKFLRDAIGSDPAGILGNELAGWAAHPFPLLVKFLDVHDFISLQVHPDDGFAFEHSFGAPGKSECWYVVAAGEEAYAVLGFSRHLSRDEFVLALESGRLTPLLNIVKLKKGDVLHVPPGTIHALGNEVLVLEVQQNSDTTYRVHDWNRVLPDGSRRETHIGKALEVINFEQDVLEPVIGAIVEESPRARVKRLVSDPKFVLESIEYVEPRVEKTDGSRFHILVQTDGDALLQHGEGFRKSMTMKVGEVVLIPAAMGPYRFVSDGPATTLRTFSPCGPEPPPLL